MDATPIRKPPPKPARTNLLLAGAALLVLAGGAAFYLSSKKARPPEGAKTVRISVNAGSCDPNELTLPAGRVTFEIVNASNRAVEWEILDGVMVLEERENIAPGISSLLTTKLHPGVYEITCGLLSAPRGKLTVTPSAASAAEAARPPTTAFIGPLAEYQVYLALETADLIEATQALGEAIRANDLDRARDLYEPARAAYLHVAPAAQRFGDLDAAIDAQADYYARREQDPGFAGFHRIAYGLFGQGGANGLAAIADKLERDVATLPERLRAGALAPEHLAAGAARRLERAASQIGASASGVKSDAAEALANLDAAVKPVDVLRPLLAKASPDLLGRIDAGFAAARPAAAALAAAAGEAVRPAREALVADLRQLSADIGKINAALGLE